MESSRDSWLPVSVQVADEVARALTSGRVGVTKTCGKLYLIDAEKRTWVTLQPIQLTIGGIRAAVAENDPWPGE